MFRFATAGLVVCAAVVGAAEVAPPPRLVDVGALVKQLGSEDYAEREAAGARLSRLRVDAVPPELLAALQSNDPEVRRRAARVIKDLREHIEASRLTKAGRFARRGQIDLYVAATAGEKWKEWDDPKAWEPALTLGQAVLRKADTKGDRQPRNCPALFDFETFKEKKRFWIMTGRYETETRPLHGATQADGLTCGWGVSGHLIVSRGSVRVSSLSQSLVVCIGNVDSRQDMRESIIICDGDILAGGDISNSVFVARGNITIKGSALASTLIAGGTVTAGELPPPPRPDVPEDRNYRVEIEEKARVPLAFITFFELSTAGVEVKAANKVVTVTSVAAGKPLATAGVRAGDVIAAVNGKAPDSAESLRRLLRDALAVGEATLTLKRDGATVEVKASLPE